MAFLYIHFPSAACSVSLIMAFKWSVENLSLNIALRYTRQLHMMHSNVKSFEIPILFSFPLG